MEQNSSGERKVINNEIGLIGGWSASHGVGIIAHELAGEDPDFAISIHTHNIGTRANLEPTTGYLNAIQIRKQLLVRRDGKNGDKEFLKWQHILISRSLDSCRRDANVNECRPIYNPHELRSQINPGLSATRRQRYFQNEYNTESDD